MWNRNFLVVTILFAGVAQISDAIPETTIRTDIKGRLLTPEEGCGQSTVPNNNRIVGGGPAKNGAWPWMALLGRNDYGHVHFTCGGTLITTRHVLSAAHCFQRVNDFVRLGEYNTDTTDDGKHIDIAIDRLEKHRDYTKVPKINDIVVITLVHDVEFTDRIRPICLPTSQNMRSLSFVGMTPFVAGWGHREENATMTNILQQVQVPVIENDECKQKYKDGGNFIIGLEYRFNETYVLCAGFTEGGRDTCQGDSGGPIMIPMHENGRFPFYQIGIVSYGDGCGRPNVPGIYTNVQKYVDWIIDKLH